MAAKRDEMLAKTLRNRRDAMNQEFNYWQGHFRELRDVIQPSRGRFEISERRGDSSINRRILDDTAKMALRTLRAGLMSGVTSPSRPWFRLGLRGSEADNAVYEVKEWLQEAQRRMYEVMRGSNVYRMLDGLYGDLGLYGTGSSLIVQDFDDVIRAHKQQVGLFRLGDDGSGRITGLYREMKMSVRGIVETWGLDNVSDQVRRDWDQGSYYQTHDICHMIDKRADGDPEAMMSVRPAVGIGLLGKGEGKRVPAYRRASRPANPCAALGSDRRRGVVRVIAGHGRPWRRRIAADAAGTEGHRNSEDAQPAATGRPSGCWQLLQKRAGRTDRNGGLGSERWRSASGLRGAA